MRDVVLQMQVSLDGYVGLPDGDVEWALPNFDEEFTAWTVDSLWRSGVHIMGGETGKELAAYWPTATEERDLPFKAPMNDLPKVVFSKSIDHLDWHDTRIANGGLGEEIGRLKQEPGKDILVHGGARFARSLSGAGLIDRYQLMVHPVVLGSGLPLFPALPQPLTLELLEAKPFPSGIVLHVYRPRGRVPGGP
jgi:dihydrofolate reductase